MIIIVAFKMRKPQISRFYGDTVVMTAAAAVTIIIDGDNDGQRYSGSYF